MFECDEFADMRAIVAVHRTLGLTLVTPSTYGNPEVRIMNGRIASLVDEARSLSEFQDPDFVDPNSVEPNDLFIGKHSLAWLLSERRI